MHPIIFNSQSSWLITHDHSEGLYTSSNSPLRCLYSPDKGDFSERIAKMLAVEKVTGRRFIGNGICSSAKLAQASRQGEKHTSKFLLLYSRKAKEKKRTVLDRSLLFQRVDMMLLGRVLHPSTSSVYLPRPPQPGFWCSGGSSTESRTALFYRAQRSDRLGRFLHCLCKWSVPALHCQGQETSTLIFWHWNPVTTSSGWRLVWVSIIMLIFSLTRTCSHHNQEGTWKDHLCAHQLYPIFPEPA